MGIISKIKEAFSSEPKQTEEMVKQNINPVKPNTPVNPIKPKKKQQDSHLYTKVIAHDVESQMMMILISYTEEYFYPMIEFLSLASGAVMSSISMKSSYDQDSGKVDKYGEPIMLSHDRYYVLMSIMEYDLQYLFHETTSLDNDILAAITQDIYDYCSPFLFDEACNAGVLDNSQFKNTINSGDDECKIFGEYDSDGLTFQYMIGYQILKQLTECFNARDILDLILVKITCEDDSEVDETTSLYEILYDYTHDQMDYIESYRPIFEGLLNRHVTDKDFINLASPRYLFDDDPFDEDNGRMSDEELDDIFKEEYEKFSAVNSDDIQYEDIDEQIGDDEESENMRMEDILNNNEEDA